MAAAIEIIFIYLILGTILGLIITRCRISPLVKALLIVASIWYSAYLFDLPDKLMGYPKPVVELEDGVWIAAFRVVEPSSTDRGHIYFWILHNQNEKSFTKPLEMIPISVWIPYNRALHKMLERIKKKAHGRLIVYKRDGNQKGNRAGQDIGKADGLGQKQGGGKDGVHTRGKFEILNPIAFLPAKRQ